MTYFYLHIDADAFFASCEQATRLELRGKPIAVGRERGVVTALSYEAKARGARRGMSTNEIARHVPDVSFVTSDYRKYTLFSRRLFTMIRDTFPDSVQTSIDEGYARTLAKTPEEVRAQAEVLQKEVRDSLGITISIGIGPTRTIAKLCSGLEKPNGITVVDADTITKTIAQVPLSKVAGIGARTAAKLAAAGLSCIGDLIALSTEEVLRHFHKPIQELHQELSGRSIFPLEQNGDLPQSVSRTHAFSPATRDRVRLRAELARNIEVIAEKLRRKGLVTTKLVIGAKALPDIHTLLTVVIPLADATNDTAALLNEAARESERLFTRGISYRATYAAAHDLFPAEMQTSLFDEPQQSELDQAVDAITARLGGQPIMRAAALSAHMKHSASSTNAITGTPLIYGDTEKKPLHIISLGSIR